MNGYRPTGRVFTVSTVKDSLDNLLAFIGRNQAAGADHMFVFLDDADPDIARQLRRLPGVTVVPTGRRYWDGQRPTSLNTRQVTNANLVNAALTTLPRGSWLFHLDGDECLDIDKDALLGLDPELGAVSLKTWEAVSRPRWDGPVTLFKRPLEPDDLELLALVGVIDRPSMKHYFRGHLKKAGMRPSLDLTMRVHRVEDLQGAHVQPFEADWLHVLHYESTSGEEFVRKWMAHLSSGRIRVRASRDRLLAAITSVARNSFLDEEGKRAALLELYARTTQDDLETLTRFGFLVTPDPRRHQRVPVPLSTEEAAVLSRATELLVGSDKRYFIRGPKALDRRELAARLNRLSPALDGR